MVVAAVRHGDSVSIPRGTFQLSEGDRVIVMGMREGIARLRRRILPAADASRQMVTIVGGGDVGFRLARRLERVRGIRLRVIERDAARGAAVASVVHQIDGGRASLLAVLEDGQAKVVELTVPAGYPQTALRDLQMPQESIVGTLLRTGDAIVPGGKDEIRAGDRLLICCTDAAAADVRDAFSLAAP